MAGGMHGRGHGRRGACVLGACVAGGVCGMGATSMARGACMAGGCMAGQILRDTVNERALRILLECIPFQNEFTEFCFLLGSLGLWEQINTTI